MVGLQLGLLTKIDNNAIVRQYNAEAQWYNAIKYGRDKRNSTAI